jgi:hypothetical protein
LPTSIPWKYPGLPIRMRATNGCADGVVVVVVVVADSAP